MKSRFTHRFTNRSNRPDLSLFATLTLWGEGTEARQKRGEARAVGLNTCHSYCTYCFSSWSHCSWEAWLSSIALGRRLLCDYYSFEKLKDNKTIKMLKKNSNLRATRAFRSRWTRQTLGKRSKIINSKKRKYLYWECPTRIMYTFHGIMKSSINQELEKDKMIHLEISAHYWWLPGFHFTWRWLFVTPAHVLFWRFNSSWWVYSAAFRAGPDSFG